MSEVNKPLSREGKLFSTKQSLPPQANYKMVASEHEGGDVLPSHVCLQLADPWHKADPQKIRGMGKTYPVLQD